MSEFSGIVAKLLERMQKKKGAVPEGMAGIGKYGPGYNPGPTRQFTPGPMPDVPFMPQAQVGQQQIALGDYSMQGAHGVGQPAPAPAPAPNLGMLPSWHPENYGGDPRQAALSMGPGGRNPNNLPGYAPIPGQTPNFNQTPGTSAGPAGGAAGVPHAAMAQLGMKLLERRKQDPMQWLQMMQNRWGGK